MKKELTPEGRQKAAVRKEEVALRSVGEEHRREDWRERDDVGRGAKRQQGFWSLGFHRDTQRRLSKDEAIREARLSQGSLWN